MVGLAWLRWGACEMPSQGSVSPGWGLEAFFELAQGAAPMTTLMI